MDLVLFWLLLIVSSFPIRTHSFDWKDGNGGKVKWDHDCQFPGDAFDAQRPLTTRELGADCGRLCWANEPCTHFTYFKGLCLLQNLTGSPTAQFLANASCGWVVTGLEWTSDYLDGGSFTFADGCSFGHPEADAHPNNIITTAGWESCSKKCIMNDVCTHFVYHSSTKMCELKTFSGLAEPTRINDATCGFVYNRTPRHDSEITTTTTEPPSLYVTTMFSPSILAVTIVVPLVVILVLLALLVRAIHLNKRRNRLQRDLEMSSLMSNNKKGFQTLLDGNPELINPDAPLEDQVALLPYNPKWEIPRDWLKLEKQLAAGHFGVVFQGKAMMPINAEGADEVHVAVKMVKSQSDPIAVESLVSELKILSHIGSHLNVVNLIGACTQDVSQQGSLLVVLEFCSYGSLHSYVISNRESFVNQLDDQGDLLALPQGDATVVGLEQSVGHDGYLCPLVNKDSHNQRGSNNPMKEDEGSRPLLCTRTLVCWSFQIAQGMDYLAQRRVLHGDLAARNILLAEGNVAKIADFGLSRQIKYNDGKYQKQGEEALPVKWMAIESLTDRLFSTESDVWSYGVLLWELFSLGSMPYAEVTSLKELLHFLVKEEQRLTKPAWAPNAIGELMKACWQSDPKDRPSFVHLKHKLADLVEPSAFHHYEKLNEPYVELNKSLLSPYTQMIKTSTKLS